MIGSGATLVCKKSNNTIERLPTTISLRTAVTDTDAMYFRPSWEIFLFS